VKTKRILLVPDAHHPYSDPKAWALLLKAGKRIKPDFIVVLGDLIDCYSVSSHLRDPSRRLTLEDEIESANEALDQLDDLGAKTRHYAAGNHEFRLDRYLMSNAPEVVGLGVARIDKLLRLKERGWGYTPYGRSYRVGKLNITHDVNGQAGAMAHSKAQAAFGGNVVIGHTHRMAVSYSGNLRSETHVGAMLGWLGDANATDYNHIAQSKRDWTLGFGVGVMEPNGNVHLQAIPIVAGRACVFGEIVSG
jgi:UDP-2,3-diacylglucosamine pyrophosphatase LpxH